MRKNISPLFVILLACGLVASAGPATAQLGKLKNKIKQKAEEKADKKADEKIDKVLDGSAEKPAEGPAEEAPEAAAEGEAGASDAGQAATGGAKSASTGQTATSENMALYTKYDFIPGDKVIFYDDLAREEVGEFPSRWGLYQGVFEVAKQGGRNFILCTDEGRISPKIPPGPLPPMYTVEMDFVVKGPEAKGHWFFIEWINAEDRKIGDLTIQDNQMTRLTINDNEVASKKLPTPCSAGIHTMRVMATKSTLKCYVDNERIANVPAVDGFAPVSFAVHMDPWEDENNPMMIGTFRYAEGGKTLRQQLDEAGRIVTHGILFDSGSARIKAESYKTLSDIAGLLTEDPALRLSIEGHTDSDGTDEANLTLSQDRSGSVRTYLTETFKVGADRLEIKGAGETKPIDTNDTPEGKANNRRVELVKL